MSDDEQLPRSSLSVARLDEEGVRRIDFLIVGGGLAAATAAETLSWSVPTARSSLSTRKIAFPIIARALCTPGEPLPVLNEEDYRAPAIVLLRGVRAQRLDPKRHLVYTDKAGTLGNRKLLIATGATPLRLDAAVRRLIVFTQRPYREFRTAPAHLDKAAPAHRCAYKTYARPDRGSAEGSESSHRPAPGAL